MNREAAAYYQAKTLYNTGKYSETKEILTPYTTGTGKLQYFTRYLLGDTLYTIGSGETSKEAKIVAYRASLEAYTGAYQIRKDPNLEKNYQFVEKKLKELLEQSWEKSGSGGEKNENTGSGETESGSGKKNTKNDSEKNGSWTESWSGNWQQRSTGGNNFSLGWSEGWDTTKPLTEEEKQAIEAYTQQLMRLQKQQDEFTSYDAKMENMSAEEQMRQLFEEMSGFSPMDDGKKDW